MIDYYTHNTALSVTLQNTQDTVQAEDMRAFADVLDTLAHKHAWECAPTIVWHAGDTHEDAHYCIKRGDDEIKITYGMIYHFHLAAGDCIGKFSIKWR